MQTPIRQVLLTIQASGTRTLLMGGQACVFYGAAQVSKDVDFLILADEANFKKLHAALAALAASRIAVPAFDPDVLARGNSSSTSPPGSLWKLPACRPPARCWRSRGPTRCRNCAPRSTPKSAPSRTRTAATGNHSNAKWKPSAAPSGTRAAYFGWAFSLRTQMLRKRTGLPWSCR
jgi:hypothetical protein